MKQKLVIFDVDGTLVKQISSWVTVHEYFKVEHLAYEHLKAYQKGIIDYPTFMKKDIGLWDHPINEKDIEDILKKFEIMDDADIVINTLQKKGYKIALVSAEIDILSKKLTDVLDVDKFIANGLEVDNKGILTGNGIFRVDLLNKDKILPDLIHSLNCTPENTIAVGDSKFDKTMLNFVGCGVSLGCHEELKEVSKYQIDSLSELLNII